MLETLNGDINKYTLHKGWQMYKCKYFKIRELVQPTFLSINENILWRLFDERLLRMLDKIREKYGACTVNANGLTDCGLRRLDSGTGACFSAHKFGRACDVHIRSIELKATEIKDATARKKLKSKEYNKVRENLLMNPEFDCLSFEQNSKECPEGITWLHIEVTNREKRLFNA